MTTQSLGSRYLLVDRIGQGSFGIVWRARDLVTGNLRAIKLLQQEYATDPVLVSRFVRERTALLRFRHPNVVTLHDMVVEGECLALVMDLIADGDLAAYRHRRGGRLAPGEACELTAQVCDGLAAAHAAGIVHRDLKPANVLLDAGQVRLADFGIARIAGLGETPLTASGIVMGTAPYVAPEMIRGQQPSAACDVYAAGVTLYELLAGEPPFTGHIAAILYAHLHVTPARPAAAVPDRLWELIAACLSKEPQARPSAANLAGALRSLGLPGDFSPSAAVAVPDPSLGAPCAPLAPPALGEPAPLARTSASWPATASAGLPAGVAHPAGPAGPAGRTPGRDAPRRLRGPVTTRTALAAAALAIVAIAGILISHAASGPAPGAAKPSGVPGNPRSTAAAPAGLAARAQPDGDIALSWTPLPSRDGTVSYRVYDKDVTAREATFGLAVSSAPGDHSATVASLRMGHRYEFEVAAGTGARSAPVTAVPEIGPPAGLTATADADGSVSLAWSTPDPSDWYWIYYCDVTSPPSGGCRTLASPGKDGYTRTVYPDSTGTRFDFAGLTGGQEYRFYVTAIAASGEGESAPSDVATATVAATAVAAPPAAPAGMTATPDNDAGVSLSWTAPGPSDWYWVWYRDDTVGGAFTRYKDPAARNAFTAGYLYVGHRYSFYVQAISPGGGTSVASGTASATVALAAPSNLTVTAGDGSVRLTWRQPLPGQRYWIYMNGKRLPDLVSGTSVPLGDLVNGTMYTFYVTTAAPGGHGESAPSDTVTATPRPAPPDTPTGLPPAPDGKSG